MKAEEQRERRKGVVTVMPDPLPAKQEQQQPHRQKGTITSGEIPLVPNFKTYPDVFGDLVDEYGNWLPGKVGACRAAIGVTAGSFPESTTSAPATCPGWIGSNR